MKNPKLVAINVFEIKKDLVEFILGDKQDNVSDKIWYEWNLKEDCIHALDTEDMRNQQIANYEKIGFKLAERIPLKFKGIELEEIGITCTKLVYRKDPNFMPDWSYNSVENDAFALALGWMRAKYEHVVLEVEFK
jgi:hypothetical protein